MITCLVFYLSTEQNNVLKARDKFSLTLVSLESRRQTMSAHKPIERTNENNAPAHGLASWKCGKLPSTSS